MKIFNFHKNLYAYLILISIFIIASFFIRELYSADEKIEIVTPIPPVRIGYFHGTPTNMIYRAHINNYFDEEVIDVKLYTKFLRGEEFFEVPKSEEEKKKLAEGMIGFGAVSGMEVADEIMRGEFDGGTIGSSSFVASIHKGVPLVAVAMLGYDAVPKKAIVMRNDVKINSPEDFMGKTLISLRSGPGDAIILREFLKDIGLVANKDLTVIDQVDGDYANEWLREKKIDGGLYHLGVTRRLVLSGVAYVYRPMNWMDSAISHVVLAFHKDYIESHREEVQKVVNAYVKRILYEKNLPDEQKDRSWDKGLMMEGEFQGMRVPAYDLPPKLRVDLLQEVQNLLLEYGEIDSIVDINNFIDNSFVEESWKKLN